MISSYFRQIIDELVANKEFDLTSNYPSLRKNNIAGDFKFIVIHRVYDPNQGFRFWERFSMNFYNIIKHIGIRDVNAYGLDTSNVLVESVPLVVNSECKNKIKRAEC